MRSYRKTGISLGVQTGLASEDSHHNIVWYPAWRKSDGLFEPDRQLGVLSNPELVFESLFLPERVNGLVAAVVAAKLGARGMQWSAREPFNFDQH